MKNIFLAPTTSLPWRMFIGREVVQSAHVLRFTNKQSCVIVTCFESPLAPCDKENDEIPPTESFYKIVYAVRKYARLDRRRERNCVQSTIPFPVGVFVRPTGEIIDELIQIISINMKQNFSFYATRERENSSDTAKAVQSFHMETPQTAERAAAVLVRYRHLS